MNPKNLRKNDCFLIFRNRENSRIFYIYGAANENTIKQVTDYFSENYGGGEVFVSAPNISKENSYFKF